MIPVVTPEEMAAIDRDAPEPVDVLIARAGHAVALRALAMLGGAYGRRIVVIAGKGNNGNDGRDAARRLRARGARVDVRDPALNDAIGACDLVIDAAYGTGFHGEYDAPDPHDVPVLSVDIPSGVHGLTGEAAPGAVHATETVTFAALKPGLLLQPGRSHAGAIEIVDIGLDCARATCHLVERDDVIAWLPERAVDTHKWRSALWIVAGSPGMTGAAALAAGGAQRAGAGYVRLSSPGPDAVVPAPIEVVRTPLPHVDWAPMVLDGLERFHALIVGPGLGTDPATAPAVQRAVKESPVPTVVDGDGLTALGTDVARYTHPLSVLTPHDGEYARLMGHAPDADRLAAARDLARAANATVVLKGATPVVASADGHALIVTTGDARLATAGTGDVLSGLIGGLLAQGMHPLRAAAAGAWLHGQASTLGPRRGLVASDLLDTIPVVFDELER